MPDIEFLTHTIPPRELVTFDEFCELIRENQKADLIDGMIHIAPPASIEHEDLFGFLLTVLRGYVREKGLGHLLGSRIAMKLSETNAPEPDLMFISKEKLPEGKGKAFYGAADLVIEIISPSSRRLDLVEKKDLYARFGVHEYWIIDPFRQTAQFLRNNDGNWENLPVDPAGIVRSFAIPVFWLRTDWLFAEEFPNERVVIELILSREPNGG